MSKFLVTVALAAALTVIAAPIADARHHHHGKACGGEFMYMKGGKCTFLLETSGDRPSLVGVRESSG